MPGHRIIRSTSMHSLPSRHWTVRATILFVLTLIAAGMLLARADSNFAATLRATMTDILAPAISIATKPASAVRDTKTWFSEMASLRSENVALKAKMDSMLKWQAVANELQAENEALKQLVHVLPPGKSTYTATHIVSENSGPYSRMALISGGSNENITIDQAVIGPEGLVGRVIESGKSNSRVLLITDINSRVPVLGEHSRERVIAAGGNSPALTLDYVQNDSKLEVGERLLTSGDGGVFPPGVPVGVITAITPEGISVAPSVDWSRMEMVSVVNYEL